ncbi:MAG: helix-turn-helix domain-containing protein [Janthinobacterium lividum]
MNYSTPLVGMNATGPPRASCSGCAARELCLPCTTDVRDIVLLDGLIGYRRRLARDEVLFRKGQSFAMIYAVRFGHVKSSRPDHHGHPHVTAFYMAGDLMGLEAIYSGRHACTTVALEDSEVCEIPYSRLQEAMHDSPSLMQRFQCALSHEIVREQGIFLHMDMNGAERLASLLLDLSARYVERGYSGRRFRLRMSRADMGNYLGLTIESISRLLGRFRDEGWIALDKRDIELLNYDQLLALLAGTDGHAIVT